MKLACSGCGDSTFTKFLDASLSDPHHRRVLEAEYSAELALYSIVNDNLDRARYYSNVSLQAFLRVCEGGSGGREGGNLYTEKKKLLQPIT